jgi:hypothetical protein
MSTGQDKGGSLVYATLGLLQAVGVGITAIVVVVVAIFVVSVILSAIKIVKEYERGGFLRTSALRSSKKFAKPRSNTHERTDPLQMLLAKNTPRMGATVAASVLRA